MTRNIVLALISLIALIGGGAVLFKKTVPEQKNPEQAKPKPSLEANPQPSNSVKTPAMQIDKNKTYTVILHTSEGNISIKLSNATPVTSTNFISLSKKGFYDKTIFHRVIKGFMIQAGDPLGNGTGGPGYKFADEPFSGKYTRGTVAMANSGPNTNGSQFFIMHQDTPLPKNYVIFGQVTSGLDVVDKIANAPVKSNGMEESQPVNPASINSVEILEQ